MPVETDQAMPRVTINQLYTEEVDAEFLSHSDLSQWLAGLMREQNLSLNFPKGTLPIINRTAIWNRPQFAEAVKNLLLRWALKEYLAGTLEIPGIPSDIETFLERPEVYGPGYANENLESFLSFKDAEGRTLWERQEERTKEREALQVLRLGKK